MRKRVIGLSAEQEDLHNAGASSEQSEPSEGKEPEEEAGAGTPDPEDGVQYNAELEALRMELEQKNQSLIRLQADFANYRKRMQAEQTRWESRAVGNFIREILPVVDSLQRALASAGDAGGQDNAQAWLEGITLVSRQLDDILTRHGVEAIEAVGKPFDPRIHEAMIQVETDEVPENHVVEEFQRGYLYQGEVLRPALVSVAKPLPSNSGGVTDKEESARG